MDKLDKRSIRLISMFLDHLSMTFILLPLLVILFGIVYLIDMATSSFTANLDIPFSISMTLAFMSFMIYFLKDNYRGKSIGKRFMGLQVIDRKTNTPASSFQCYIRNLLIPLWPLEVIVTLFSPSRRLGDYLTNTEVVIAEKESPTKMWAEIKKTRFTFKSWIILGIMAVYSYALVQLIYGPIF